ncbi:unnamed protein product, partial [Prorocentrum cordatum]
MYKKGCEAQDLFGAPLSAAMYFPAFRGAGVADEQAANQVQLGHDVGAALRRRAAITLGASIYDPDASDTVHPNTEGVPAIMSTHTIDECVWLVFQRARSVPTVPQLNRAAAALSLDLSKQVLHSCNNHFVIL